MSKKEVSVVSQSWEWLQKPELSLELIETAGRTCYKSEDRITPESAEKFVRMLLKNGHESVIEHPTASVRLVTNRGVLAEITRHRIASFSVESTRYCDYAGDGSMVMIKPVWWEGWSKTERTEWQTAVEKACRSYKRLRECGSRPEQARDILPHSLKTEIVMTANLREWRHIFRLRCSKKAHPQIRALMRSVRAGFRAEIPVLFDDVIMNKE